MLKENTNWHQPLVIGGLGGSGTRTVADLVQNFGIHIGTMLNPALDNLWFTFLFNRPGWKRDFPDVKSQLSAIKLIEKASITGLQYNSTSAELETIDTVANEFEEASKALGVRTFHNVASSLKNSTGFTTDSPAHWGWKEPNSHIFLPALLSYFPTLKYIHIVRHGLDMVYSKNQQQRREWKNCYHLFKPYSIARTKHPDSSIDSSTGFNNNEDELWQSLDYWIAANMRCIEIGCTMPKNNFLLLNYEQLCYNPTEISVKIANFLEIDKHHIGMPNSTNKIEPASTIGRYKDHPSLALPNTYIEAIEKIGYSI